MYKQISSGSLKNYYQQTIRLEVIYMYVHNLAIDFLQPINQICISFDRVQKSSLENTEKL